MYKKKKILAIIPARSGSKGLKNKNIKIIKKKPLIFWTILRAKQSKFIDNIVVSSDYQNIKNIYKEDKKISFVRRPKKYSTDKSSAFDVIKHLLDLEKKQNKIYEYIVYLEPTSPLRYKKDIDNCIKKLIDNQKYDSLVTLGEVQEHPEICKKIIQRRVLPFIIKKSITAVRRQDFKKAYFPYGVCYLSRVTSILKKKTFYTNKTTFFNIKRLQNIEIDKIDDFIITKKLMDMFF